MQKEILKKIKDLNLSAAGAPKTEVLDGIRQYLDCGAFNKHNQAGIVEARAIFKATRGSEKLWELKIIWGTRQP